MGEEPEMEQFGFRAFTEYCTPSCGGAAVVTQKVVDVTGFGVEDYALRIVVGYSACHNLPHICSSHS
jgi:hypothetical protein